MGREVILQKLYQGCKEVDVWNKSNGFIINQITNEGAKWATRILARRLISIESNTYLSHQWAVVAAKLNDGCERSRKLPEYVKKQWREVQRMKDDQATYASLIVANAPDDKRLVPVWPRLAWIEQTIGGFTHKYTPNSTLRPKGQRIMDYPLVSPMAQYHY
eukprot:Gb_21144 [translate_table: standard]